MFHCNLSKRRYLHIHTAIFLNKFKEEWDRRLFYLEQPPIPFLFNYSYVLLSGIPKYAYIKFVIPRSANALINSVNSYSYNFNRNSSSSTSHTPLTKKWLCYQISFKRNFFQFMCGLLLRAVVLRLKTRRVFSIKADISLRLKTRRVFFIKVGIFKSFNKSILLLLQK